MIHRHKKERGFVTLDKTALNDHGLSWAAKGLHSYLMGLPDDWRVNLVDLSQRSKSAKAATTTAMDELIAAGYVFRQKVIAAGNRFAGYQYQMFETPTEAENWKSANGISVVGKPDYGKPEHGESEYGKSATNKGLRNQGIEIVNIEELSNEGDAPAHFADAVKVSKGQPVVDFVPESLIEVEITGPEPTKRKPSKKATQNKATQNLDLYYLDLDGNFKKQEIRTHEVRKFLTPEEQFPAENNGPEGGWSARTSVEVFAEWFATQNHPELDPALIYADMQAWAVNRGSETVKKAGGYDWRLVPGSWMRRDEGQRVKWVRKATETVAAQVKMAQAAGYQPTLKEIAAAQYIEYQERNAAK